MAKTAGRKTKYKWAEWFRQPHFVLMPNVHFTCVVSTMVQNVRNQASKRGYKVSVREIPNNGHIVVDVTGRK